MNGGKNSEVVSGFWEPEFLPLVRSFQEFVEAGKEHGGLCLMADGITVVDIYGGDAGYGQPWRQDTLACCFSVTKGVLSLLAHKLIDDGVLSLGARIADYWPEFGTSGKAELTVLDALTHRCGVPAVSGSVSRGMLYDWSQMTEAIAASAPVVPLTGAPVYHNMTYGYLLGEIVCRATGVRPLSRLLRDQITGPLGVDFHLGLSDDLVRRAAEMRQADPNALFRALEADPNSLFARSMAFFGEHEDFNTRSWRTAEIGSGNGHTTARALATLYGQFVWENSILSKQRREAARTLQLETDGPDPILGMPITYGQGVELSRPPGLDFGPNKDAVGHWGAGGSTGFADPANGLSFGYVTGAMSDVMGSSMRARSYVKAIYADVRS